MELMMTQQEEHGSEEPLITEHYKTLYYLIIYSVYDATQSCPLRLQWRDYFA
jgi:hypothetical protein